MMNGTARHASWRSGLQLRSPDHPGTDCSLLPLLAVDLTNLHIDGGGCVLRGWLGLKNFGPLCLMYVGTGQESVAKFILSRGMLL